MKQLLLGIYTAKGTKSEPAPYVKKIPNQTDSFTGMRGIRQQVTPNLEKNLSFWISSI